MQVKAESDVSQSRQADEVPRVMRKKIFNSRKGFIDTVPRVIRKKCFNSQKDFTDTVPRVIWNKWINSRKKAYLYGSENDIDTVPRVIQIRY